VIRLVVDGQGRLVAVEELGDRRGVVRVDGTSLKRFAQAVNEEFPEVRVEVHKG
jgi:hypothetical protein